MATDLKVYYDNKRHIICTPYTVDNLHRAAQLLGLKSCWFHRHPYPHYDMPKRWVQPMTIGEFEFDEALMGLEAANVAYEQVSVRELLNIIKRSPL
jgi:hypothetical protein